MTQTSTAYFDNLPEKFEEGNQEALAAFGKHIHWGYWENPKTATGNLDDFAVAADNLSKKVCQAASIENNQNILDVGCGFGGTISWLNDNFNHLNLVGVNIDAQQLVRAREKVLPQGNNTIDFIEANACQIPLMQPDFDRVLALECIFSFPSREQFFKEAYRLLKEEGKLTICDFLPTKNFAGIWQWIEHKINPLVGQTYGKPKAKNALPINFIPISKYEEIAKKTGFKLRKIEDINRNTLPTYPLVNRLMCQDGDDNMVRSTQGLEFVSKLGLIRYMILDFEKD
ncbi:methyltransferase domain-containing protein [Crocosphaera sp. UHCC 0190]|uniref:class I SAM-dependent methyltransferase n=1 Tax=Crocosphaera sp. UHCC 0190 TaxID=3110246 RepID=UPI002B21E88B|nr:methyltransferase domain-containing protein [Crocosphaera sp. UHCC 0190]MEA5512361.1 methyltransferase domain-containing protein [Crocosphaera sp. UHCC 0190]